MTNKQIEKYFVENSLTVMDSDESRPWGGYYIFEVGVDYDKKILSVNPGQFLSLQFHGSRDHAGHSEEWLAVSDIYIVIGDRDVSQMELAEIFDGIENGEINLEVKKVPTGENIVIQSGYLHALVNPTNEQVILQETRKSQKLETSQEREDNITRLYDQSGRAGTRSWPEDLVLRIEELV